MGGFGVREILFCLEMNNNEHFWSCKFLATCLSVPSGKTVFNISAWHF